MTGCFLIAPSQDLWTSCYEKQSGHTKMVTWWSIRWDHQTMTYSAQNTEARNVHDNDW